MASPAETRERRVWDPVVRISHWCLVVAVLGAWVTHEGGGRWHEWLGYAALVVLAVRLPWGFFGPRHARFSQFVRGPEETARYAKAVLQGSEPRHRGHNPLGGWMIVALLVMVALSAGSGWLYVTDRFWGLEWVENLHGGLSNALLVLIVLHVAGVVFTSIRQRENLVAAMFHGRKRGAGEGDID